MEQKVSYLFFLSEEIKYFTNYVIQEQEGEAEVVIIADNPENPWCPKCGKGITDEQAQLYHCNLCRNFFHEACGVAHQTQWFCPVCVINESPTKHYASLLKVLNFYISIFFFQVFYN